MALYSKPCYCTAQLFGDQTLYFYYTEHTSIVFYINLVATLKHIHKEEGTSINTFIGSLLLGFIMLLIIAICGR